ncbi:MAG: methyltransferase [Thermodesulfobacteriota bacterium]
MSRDAQSGPPGETVDGILGGRLRIIQSAKGYRFSLDALLLAAFADLRAGDDLIDLGTGSGVIALILADRHRCGRVLGVEIQEQLAVMARRSAAMNHLAGRVEIRRGDVRLPAAICPPRSFDAAVFNPPYRRLGSGRTNRDSERAVARHEIEGDAGDFIAFAGYALREGGRAYTIYPAKRIVDMLCRMRAAAVEPKRLRIVHSRPGAAGVFALVEGVKGGREELAVLPPLFIYRERGGYTAEMRSIMEALSATRLDGGG